MSRNKGGGVIGGVRKQTRHRAAHRSLSMPELQSVGCRLEALRAAEECIEEGTLCLGMHKPAQDPSDYECSICTEMLLDPVVAPCGHDFCKGCLDMWAQVSRQARPSSEAAHALKCPICRAELSGKLGVCRRLQALVESSFPEEVAKRRAEADRLAAEAEHRSRQFLALQMQVGPVWAPNAAAFSLLQATQLREPLSPSPSSLSAGGLTLTPLTLTASPAHAATTTTASAGISAQGSLGLQAQGSYRAGQGVDSPVFSLQGAQQHGVEEAVGSPGSPWQFSTLPVPRPDTPVWLTPAAATAAAVAAYTAVTSAAAASAGNSDMMAWEGPGLASPSGSLSHGVAAPAPASAASAGAAAAAAAGGGHLLDPSPRSTLNGEAVLGGPEDENEEEEGESEEEQPQLSGAAHAAPANSSAPGGPAQPRDARMAEVAASPAQGAFSMGQPEGRRQQPAQEEGYTEEGSEEEEEPCTPRAGGYAATAAADRFFGAFSPCGGSPGHGAAALSAGMLSPDPAAGAAGAAAAGGVPSTPRGAPSSGLAGPPGAPPRTSRFSLAVARMRAAQSPVVRALFPPTPAPFATTPAPSTAAAAWPWSFGMGMDMGAALHVHPAATAPAMPLLAAPAMALAPVRGPLPSAVPGAPALATPIRTALAPNAAHEAVEVVAETPAAGAAAAAAAAANNPFAGAFASFAPRAPARPLPGILALAARPSPAAPAPAPVPTPASAAASGAPSGTHQPSPLAGLPPLRAIMQAAAAAAPPFAAPTAIAPAPAAAAAGATSATAAGAGAGAGEEWRSADVDRALRTTCLSAVASVFSTRYAAQLGQEAHPRASLYKYVQAIEERLYRTAPTRQLYADLSTLHDRVVQAVQDLTGVAN